MSYKEGITVNGKHSFVDFGLNISNRKIELPPKNSIRKTIPYMSGFYDFTTLNGVATFGERTISYTFDIIGATVTEMDSKRTEVVNWFCNMHDVDIYDDTIPDYHFHGSFDSVSQNEDGEKTELTITFVCEPFMVANKPATMFYNDTTTRLVVYNGQPVSIYGKGGATLQMGGYITTLNSDEMVDTGLVLTAGEHELKVSSLNLLPYPYKETSGTTNGITFTDNNGVVTANGNAAQAAIFGVADMTLPEGTYGIDGTQIGEYEFARIVVADMEGNILAEENGSGAGFTLESEKAISIYIIINKGFSVANFKFSPRLTKLPIAILEYTKEVL